MSTDTRIESLERQVRTLKRLLFGVFALVVVVGLLMSDDVRSIGALQTQVRALKHISATNLQSVPDVIQAKKFQVVTDEGKVIVGLGDGGGGGLLRIFNQYGKQFAVLGLRGEGEGGLGISNKDGVEVAALLAYEDLGMLGIYNKDGEPVAGINATPYGGALHISNKDQKRVAEIRADAGGGLFRIQNKDGKYVAGIYTETNGGLLSVSNGDGQPAAAIFAGADGNGVVRTLDAVSGQTTSESP
jgi:hypothetical protein